MDEPGAGGGTGKVIPMSAASAEASESAPPTPAAPDLLLSPYLNMADETSRSMTIFVDHIDHKMKMLTDDFDATDKAVAAEIADLEAKRDERLEIIEARAKRDAEEAASDYNVRIAELKEKIVQKRQDYGAKYDDLTKTRMKAQAFVVAAEPPNNDDKERADAFTGDTQPPAETTGNGQ